MPWRALCCKPGCAVAMLHESLVAAAKCSHLLRHRRVPTECCSAHIVWSCTQNRYSV
jgi:hypothetical protein